MEVQDATQRHYTGLSSEQEYRQQLLDIQNSYYDQVLSSTEISEELKNQIKDQKEKQSLKQTQQNYDEYKAKVKQQVSFAQDIGKQFGETFAEMLTDSETSLGDFLKATVVLILDTLEKTMMVYIAESTMSSIAKTDF